MNIKVQRWVDRWMGVPLCRALSWAHALAPRRHQQRDASEVQQVMVVLLSEMGSLVLAYPMFCAIRERFPNARIHTLMFAKNKEVLGLLDIRPEIHVITVRDTGIAALVMDAVKAIWHMRALRLDAILDCELFSRISAIFCALSGARERVGFHRLTQEGLYRGDFFTQKLLYNPHKHIADQFLNLVNAVGASALPPVKVISKTARQYPRPRLAVTPQELDAARAKLHQLVPSSVMRPLALLYASGGLLPIRAWPQSSFESVARSWIDRGYTVGVIGLPSDVTQARSLVAGVASEHCQVLAGQTASVRELVVFFHLARVLVANDGGPGHFAALADLPTVMLFGPESPRLYGSLAPRVIALHREDVPCSPCLTAFNHRLSPCDGDNQCLKRVSVADALAAAEAAVQHQPECTT